MAMLSKLADVYKTCERFADLVRLREMLGTYVYCSDFRWKICMEPSHPSVAHTTLLGVMVVRCGSSLCHRCWRSGR